MHRPATQRRAPQQGVVGPAGALPGSDRYALAVLAVVELIPAGRVLTYGDVAELLEGGGPRQVGRVLSHSTREVPWWRVLRAGGHPPRGLGLRARLHYDEEGTVLSVPPGAAAPDDYRVDLSASRWWPADSDLPVIAALRVGLRPPAQ
jgi:alkylated DNA nucleotide flippase Atl1